MPTIYIDKQPYEVREGLNLLQAILELGFNLPFFCWHPAMGSVGACRQCAIKQFKDANDTRGRIVMACMTPAANNSYISVFDPDVVEFRSSIIEWLMMNHPHDCPVCDEGGECHLQDMTMMTGHDYRRYTGKKRTFYNQYLGPFINHEMNRCIQCYRCVRFYRDFAGGKDFNVFSLHNTAYFGRAEEGVLESEFSGNLVEVCPTGVFTDKTLKEHYVRKWDLQNAPSICVNCSVGCNTTPGERYNSLRRIVNRYNSEVNGYFLCDRGRYGYEFVNSERRIQLPRFDGTPTPTKETVLSKIGEILPGNTAGGSARLMGIGSPRASLESNFALRTMVGAENFYQGISETEQRLVTQIIDILQKGPARSPSLQEIAKADAVLVLGEDVSNTAPMIAFSLRQSIRQQPLKQAAKLRIPDWDEYSNRQVIQHDKGPLFIATPSATRIDDIATATYRAAPDDLARLAFAVAHALDASAPDVEHLSDPQREQVKAIAAALLAAERPLIVSGTSLGSEAVIQAAASIAWALAAAGRPASLSYAFSECNSLGLGLMGGQSLEAALQKAQSGQVDALIVLENDLYRRVRPTQVNALLQSAPRAIVLDSLENPTTERAYAVLPAGTFAESSGSLVNNEGRVQRFYQVYVPNSGAQPSWRWILDILRFLGRPEGEQWKNLDDVQAALAAALPVFQPLLEVAPPAGFRMAGAKIAREPARWSGRTANTANIGVHEPPPPPDPDTPLTYSMEGIEMHPNHQPPPALIPRFWAPGWNSIQAILKYQSQIAGPLKGGPTGCRLIEPGFTIQAPVTQTGSESTQLTGASEAPVPENQATTPEDKLAPDRQGPPGNQTADQKEQLEQKDQTTGPVHTSAGSQAARRPDYFTQIPSAYEPRSDAVLVVPLYHVFGSEEMSVHSKSIAELAPEPYIAVNIEDAAAMAGVALPITEPGQLPKSEDLQNMPFALDLDGTVYRLPVRFTTDLPRGTVGLPVGLPGIETAALPAYGRLTRAGWAGEGGGG